MKISSGRIFASNYQVVVCDDPQAPFDADAENWNEQSMTAGFAGNQRFRALGTEADLNDHWVEISQTESPPSEGDWDRIICTDFVSTTGLAHVMSVVDDEPVISLAIERGNYALYFAGNNMGVDQMSLEEDDELTDQQLAARKDLEHYQIYLVEGVPDKFGRLKDV